MPDLRFYETTANLGGAFVNTLLFTQPITLLSTPNAQFDVQTGYTNLLGNSGELIITNNEMVFNSGDPVTPTVIGLYVLYSSDKAQQCVVDVTDIVTITTVTINFILEPIVNDLFDTISTQLSIDGGDRYRCITIRNDNTLDFTGGKIWVLSQVSEGSVSIGFDPSGVNGTPTTSDGETVPAGVTFSAPITEGTGVVIPTLSNNDHIFLWIKRTNIVGTTKDTFRLTLDISGSFI